MGERAEEMNEQEKSIELAKLMVWKTWLSADFSSTKVADGLGNVSYGGNRLDPYGVGLVGKAQFAEILLKFPEVIERFVSSEGHTHLNTTTEERYRRYGGMFQGFITAEKPFTQCDVLDEILRMNEVDI